MWPGELRAGERCRAKLTAKLAGTRRGVALLDNGSEALVDHLPPDVTEGQMLDVVITRAALAERGRLKRAQARVAADNAPTTPSPIADGTTVRRFAAGLWEEVWHAGVLSQLRFSRWRNPRQRYPGDDRDRRRRDRQPRATWRWRRCLPLARALAWFELGGNIGIDFPTPAAKADRRRGGRSAWRRRWMNGRMNARR